MQTTQPNIQGRRLSPEDVRKVAPALETYTQEHLYGDVWKRPGLATRDRSLITIAALIARDQSPALTYYLNQALENGVKPREAIGIARSGSQPSRSGPAQNFTGSVRIDPLFDAKEPSRTSGAYVTFEPRARTAWHTHPHGQTLIVTAGTGRVQRWADPVAEIRPGDVVWIPPGQKHWHGASPMTAMTHIAIQETTGGTNVQWMEHVTDEQYGK